MYVYMKQTLEGTENYIQRKYEYKLFYQTKKEMKKRDHKLVASNVYIFNLVVVKKKTVLNNLCTRRLNSLIQTVALILTHLGLILIVNDSI